MTRQCAAQPAARQPGARLLDRLAHRRRRIRALSRVAPASRSARCEVAVDAQPLVLGRHRLGERRGAALVERGAELGAQRGGVAVAVGARGELAPVRERLAQAVEVLGDVAVVAEVRDRERLRLPRLDRVDRRPPGRRGRSPAAASAPAAGRRAAGARPRCRRRRPSPRPRGGRRRGATRGRACRRRPSRRATRRRAGRAGSAPGSARPRPTGGRTRRRRGAWPRRRAASGRRGGARRARGPRPRGPASSRTSAPAAPAWSKWMCVSSSARGSSSPSASSSVSTSTPGPGRR